MNTGVGSHFLLQGIFLTQGLNPHTALAGRLSTTSAIWEAVFLLGRTQMNPVQGLSTHVTCPDLKSPLCPP